MTEEEWLTLLHAAWERGERLVDLDAVHGWVQRQRPYWESRGLRVDVRPPTQRRDKDSLAVTFESETLVGHLIVWDSGEYELGRILLSTDDDALVPYRPAHTADELIRRITEQMELLGIT